MLEVLTKEPTACGAAEITEFSALVIEGREVVADTLPRGIQRSIALAFLRVDDVLVGVAGLKRPADSYRAKISDRSGVELHPQNFPFELGWVYVRDGFRGGKSKLLCDALLPYSEGQGVFATSRMNKLRMHATLKELKFEQVGAQWASGENPARLALFTRAAGLN